jgi:hypothetical protein
VRAGEGFRLTLGDLSIGAVGTAAAAPAPARRAPVAGADSGAVFPPYGRSKGAPIAGASMADLEFYANGCRGTLADAAKSRWHDKERSLLAAIEAEIAHQSTRAGDDHRTRPTAGGQQSFDDDRPPHTDDDMPF